MPRPPLQRVLYAEDEPDIREIAQLALEGVGGLQVTACADGAAAVIALPEARPDLLLLDVMMPGMDGPETLAALRQLPAGAEVPVVFMTAKVQPGEVAQLVALGALGVIAKPFDPMTLADRLHRLWQKNDA